MRVTIPLARPSIGEAEVEAAAATLRSGWITQGPEVAAFEREFAAWVGAEHACAVSNCTAALHLALMVVGVGPADEVITVSHSFIATANSVRYCGAIPVFVDVQPTTYNIDPARIEAVISERTRAASRGATRCRLWKTRPAPSAARSRALRDGNGSASRTATWRASPFTRASSSRRVMAA
jgi:dTDP-4-amino-4,6-dideoxygalactose transaminase